MNKGRFVISLDFEMFWGVCDAQTVAAYGQNVLGEWQAVPRLLTLFRQHGIRVTWATVGMLMCRDFAQWRAIRPAVLPGYLRADCSPYAKEEMAREHPRLFFARPLVERILATPGQELGSHTYSHFYCREPGATPEQFAADLQCAQDVAAELGTQCRTLVLPRNQVVQDFLAVLPGAGIRVYRGNVRHWLYRDGDAVAGGVAGRAARFADACIPLSGAGAVREQGGHDLVNLPASRFLYPCSALHGGLLELRLRRIRQGMSAAAKAGSVFHLWWHPHNFGVHLDQNLAMLGDILLHYRSLADRYGMQSQCMGDFADPASQHGRLPSAQACAPGGARPIGGFHRSAP
jgi:hypothetical protein